MSYYLLFTIVSFNLVINFAYKQENCEQCMPIEQCSAFTQMNIKDQSAWQRRFICNENKLNNTTTFFGFAAVAKGDYVCCPNSQIWGIGGTNTYRNKTGNTTSSNDTKLVPNDQDVYGQPNYYNNPNDYGYSQNNPRQNMYQNQPSNQYDGDQQYPRNYYGNNGRRTRPVGDNANGDENNYPRYYGDQSRSPNFYGGQQNLYGRRHNRPSQSNQYWNHNPFGRNQNVFNNQQNLNRPQYPATNDGYWNNQVPTQYQNGRGISNPTTNYPEEPNEDNQNSYFQQNAQSTPNQYPVQNQGANSNGGVDFDQQCASQKNSFPPNAETGCCGKDLSDSPKVTDLQYLLNMFAPSSQTNTQNRPRATYPRGDGNWPSNINPRYQSRRKRSADKNATLDLSLDNRIAGGQETELDQFPWTVLMKTTFDYGDKIAAFSCGGSLISRRYILTAGHCVYEPKAKINDIEVTLAEYDKRTYPEDCVMVFGGRKKCIENVRMHAEDVVHHPQYDDDKLLNDIALIRLRGWAPYTRFIRPVCLPPFNIDANDYSNLPLAVAGWGRDGTYETDIKQSTIVRLIPHDDCEKSYPHLTTSHICAAGRTGEDTCKGDSGGPLMMLYRKSYYVIGIVSGKRADSPCGSKVPSLYTNVYKYLDWIQNTIRN